jgi:arsenical pump membrane protein
MATAGIVGRPFRLPEAVWAVAGAALLIALGLVPLETAGRAVAKGLDVYLFLIGMMLLSETARREGLFDWVAVHAVNWARGSVERLFALVFAVGVVVTAFLSNDATAVVLTPAVYAAARNAKADPLPMLFGCAFVANAASFVLPISNPANLVLYGGQMPPLGAWLRSFALPSLVSIAATFLALRWAERKRLPGGCAAAVEPVALSRGGAIALGGIVLTAIGLVTVSALDIALGLPTCLAGVATILLVCIGGRQSPLQIVRDVSWSILPLVAGLFVLVEALAGTGATGMLADWLRQTATASPEAAAGASGVFLAVASNLMNNLPAGLLASNTIAQATPPRMVTDALLIGVDLGPNLSRTGSLATILWLGAIRREGEDVGFWRFLKVGAIVMPPALLLALGARLALG